MTWTHLERGSSPVDWCEQNYSISPVIAEFVNTISNVFFLLFPPLLMHLFKDYAEIVNPAIHVLWVLLMIVGVSSAYFHATLSLAGQLLDELAILWVCMAAFAMFFPKKYFPSFCQRDRRFLGVLSVIFSVMTTGFLMMHPAANAFALMAFSLPAVFFLVEELRRVKCPRVYRLGIRCTAIWFVAVLCWINDRLFCETWSSLNFPYLHGFWHILIANAAYTILVLFAYFSVINEMPEQTPVMQFWPNNHFELGIPYVSIKIKQHADTFAQI